MNRILVLFISVLTTIGTVNVAHAQLDWELSFPFRQFGKYYFPSGENRYFEDDSIGESNWQFRRDLYVHDDCLSSSRPIHCSERRVGPSRFANMLNSVKTPPRQHYGGVKSNSWLAEAYLDRGNSYSGRAYRYRDNYIQPLDARDSGGRKLRHRIRVWMDDDALRNQQCEFRVDGSPWYEANCADGTRLSLFRGEPTSKLEGRVKGSGQILSLSGDKTLVREVVVAAVGDSYAAGEGAPDIPARIKFVRGKIERQEAEGSRYPVHDNAAHWAERNCHRSFLSSQARAVIHYAATHPKTETSMLHVACSGAEVLSGLLGPYSGASETNWMKLDLERRGLFWRTTLSQYNQLVLALCRDPQTADYIRQFNRYVRTREVKRTFENPGDYLPMQTDLNDPFAATIECRGGFKKPIDALLIGISGNDHFFFDAVKDSLVEFPFKSLAGAVSPQEAGDRARARSAALFRKIDRGNTSQLKVPRDRVIVAAYPLGVRDSDGSFCRSREGLGSFNIIAALTGGRFGGIITRPRVTRRESRELHDDFGVPLNMEIAKAVDRHDGWRLADEHVALFDGHGWCAGDATITRDSSYNPYLITRRWIRTADDGFASQNRLPNDLEKRNPRVFNEMLKTYGLMHPNGLGAAVMADSYYKRLVEILD